MSEFNPNHPITAQVHDQWHKLCAILMARQGLTEVEIKPSDIALLTEGTAIVADARGGRFVLRLVDQKEAERLARKEGGLPV